MTKGEWLPIPPEKPGCYWAREKMHTGWVVFPVLIRAEQLKAYDETNPDDSLGCLQWDGAGRFFSHITKQHTEIWSEPISLPKGGVL
jgi:hypothetical protein